MKVTSYDILNLVKAFEVDKVRGYTDIRNGLICAINKAIKVYREQLNEKEVENNDTK